MIYIGIDAGTKTGVAIWDNSKQTLEAITLNFWTAYEHIKTHYHPESAKIIIEDPNKIKPVFIGNKIKNQRVKMNMAQKVGMVKRESSLLADGLEKAGFLVKRTKPCNTKKDAEYIKRVTGYSKRTNDHQRDAIMLVYGL